jgi:hypothetical protein
MQIKSKKIFVCPECQVAIVPNWDNQKCPVCNREFTMDDLSSLPTRELSGPPDEWEKRVREDFGSRKKEPEEIVH